MDGLSDTNYFTGGAPLTTSDITEISRGLAVLAEKVEALTKEVNELKAEFKEGKLQCPAHAQRITAVETATAQIRKDLDDSWREINKIRWWIVGAAFGALSSLAVAVVSYMLNKAH